MVGICKISGIEYAIIIIWGDFMDMNLVSIIIPIYNVSKYLDRCIEFVCDQTYKNLEIILVDDGSTDNCPKSVIIGQKKIRGLS